VSRTFDKSWFYCCSFSFYRFWTSW